jgi:hypothetical protein
MFKIGDRVIPLNLTQEEKQICGIYVPRMDNHIGQIGVISRVEGVTVLVRFDCDSWNYHKSWLKYAVNDDLKDITDFLEIE